MLSGYTSICYKCLVVAGHRVFGMIIANSFILLQILLNLSIHIAIFSNSKYRCEAMPRMG